MLRRPTLLMLVIAVLVIALDRLSKLWIVEWMDLQSRLLIEVAPPFLQFQMAWNRGINFGLFGNDAAAMRWALVALAVVVSVGLAIWVMRGAGRWAAIAVGFIAGGALGNAWDRVVYGAVADFLNMSCCGFDNPFSFNIADAAIFAGAIGLIFLPDPKKDDAGGA